MKTKQDILEFIEENEQRFTHISNQIWLKPELSFQEFFSSKLQADFLEENGFHIQWDIAGMNTAFIAEWGSQKPIIAFAGEYDALPGLSQKVQDTIEPLVDGSPGHACGHNLLGVAHLAAALAVKTWLKESGFSGTVRYYGCPAEEAGNGKTFMARAGLFDDLDAAFNFHPMFVNFASKGSVVALNDITFRFHGLSSHAGAAPHMGRSALDAVELMNVGVNYLREHVPSDVRMHYVITNGGKAPNIVPHEAEVWYCVRARFPDTLREINGRVENIARGAALMTGTSVEIIFNSGVSNLLNNKCLSDLQYDNMKIIGAINFTPEEIAFAEKINAAYPENTFEALSIGYCIPPEILRGKALVSDNFPAMDEGKCMSFSTDVGDLSWRTPLSLLMTACFPTNASLHTWGATASAGMSIGHKGMLHAAKIMALSAIDLFAEPERLIPIRNEFEDGLKAHPYQCPIPSGLQPPMYFNPVRSGI